MRFSVRARRGEGQGIALSLFERAAGAERSRARIRALGGIGGRGSGLGYTGRRPVGERKDERGGGTLSGEGRGGGRLGDEGELVEDLAVDERLLSRPGQRDVQLRVREVLVDVGLG